MPAKKTRSLEQRAFQRRAAASCCSCVRRVRIDRGRTRLVRWLRPSSRCTKNRRWSLLVRVLAQPAREDIAPVRGCLRYAGGLGCYVGAACPPARSSHVDVPGSRHLGSIWYTPHMPHRRRTGCVLSVLASKIQTWSHMASASRARRYCSESSRIVVGAGKALVQNSVLRRPYVFDRRGPARDNDPGTAMCRFLAAALRYYYL